MIQLKSQACLSTLNALISMGLGLNFCSRCYLFFLNSLLTTLMHGSPSDRAFCKLFSVNPDVLLVSFVL